MDNAGELWLKSYTCEQAVHVRVPTSLDKDPPYTWAMTVGRLSHCR